MSFFKALVATLALAAVTATAAEVSPETQLKHVVEQIRDGRNKDAYRELETVVQRAPDFQLARSLYTELAASLGSGGKVEVAAATENPRLQQLVEEAQLRLSPPKLPAGAVPSSLLQLASNHRYAVVVDLPRARLYVLENQKGGLKVVREQYAAMGRNGAGKHSKGDLRTPIGIYTVTGFTDARKLPDLYGSGAFPITYPNIWDRHHGRDGSGIWLHGVPKDVNTRAPRSSEGCVTMANDDLLALRPYLQAGETPVILADSVQWLAPSVIDGQRNALLTRIENWRSRWSAIDTEAYLGFYADDFVTDGMNKKAFSEYKRRVNATKSRIKVQLRNLDLMRYPGEENLVMAQFQQDYSSSNFTVSSFKQQFWQLQKDGSWKIVLEESH